MIYLLISFICVVFGLLPTLIFARERFKRRAVLGGRFWLILAVSMWSTADDIVGPYFGVCVFFVIAQWLVYNLVDKPKVDEDSDAIASRPYDGLTMIFAGVLVIFVISPVLGWKVFRSGDYAGLIGQIEQKTWSKDVQPKSQDHVRLVNSENALFKAENSLQGEIGAQFEVAKELMTLQVINGKLWYIVPLDFKSFGTWRLTDGVPAYVKISAEDDDIQSELVPLPKGKRFRYTPAAFFRSNLERHIRLAGYINDGLCDYSLEVNEDGTVWWVITTYQPSIWNSGKKVTGVLVVDPSSGDIKQFSVGNIPKWIDRVVPEDLALDYVMSWGSYRNGFWNTMPIVGSGEGMIKPVDARLYYGSDNEPYFVYDMTSIGTDTSMTGVMYICTKTGKAAYYQTEGGSTSKVIIEAINKHSQVQYKHLHADIPQLYNIYGKMASIALLLNDQHVRQGVAVVNNHDVSQVAIGRDLAEAMGNFQEFLTGHAKGKIHKDAEIKVYSGVVDRVYHEVGLGGNVSHRLHLEGIPRIFFGSDKVSVKIALTKEGDRVSVGFLPVEGAQVPLVSFDNLDLIISGLPEADK